MRSDDSCIKIHTSTYDRLIKYKQYTWEYLLIDVLEAFYTNKVQIDNISVLTAKKGNRKQIGVNKPLFDILNMIRQSNNYKKWDNLFINYLNYRENEIPKEIS